MWHKHEAVHDGYQLCCLLYLSTFIGFIPRGWYTWSLHAILSTVPDRLEGHWVHMKKHVDQLSVKENSIDVEHNYAI